MASNTSVSYTELWEEIPNTDGRFFISNYGRIKRLRFTKTTTLEFISYGAKGASHNYRMVDLRGTSIGRNVTIHTLVATAFIGPCPEGKEVNHKDFDRQNNKVDNLEYITHRDNIQHAAAAGRVGKWVRTAEICEAISKQKSGQIASNRKLTKSQVNKILKLHKDGMSAYRLSQRFPVCKKTILKIVNGQTYKRW